MPSFFECSGARDQGAHSLAPNKDETFVPHEVDEILEVAEKMIRVERKGRKLDMLT